MPGIHDAPYRQVRAPPARAGEVGAPVLVLCSRSGDPYVTDGLLVTQNRVAGAIEREAATRLSAACLDHAHRVELGTCVMPRPRVRTAPRCRAGA